MSIFDVILNNLRWGVDGRGGAQGGPNYHRNQDKFDFGIYDIDFGINDKGFYTPDSTTGGAAADWARCAEHRRSTFLT